jgi:hypothetical protein
MVTVTRQQIFAQAAKKLRNEFDELSTVPHNALKGHEAEKLVRRFLENHIPKRFDVGSGFIIDQLDNLSKQSDVIIYDAFNCPVYRASEDAAILPSDNVAAVVEVKATLDKEKLSSALENIWASKSLAKTKTPDPRIALITYQTLGFVFAFESPLTLSTLASHYATLIRSKGIGRHIDAILVLDRGLITLGTKPRGLPWTNTIVEGLGGPATEGAHVGVVAQEFGNDSLDVFLRFMLTHLIHFRPFVGLPGFDWTKTEAKGMGSIEYLTSITHETDPKKREENLQKYAAEAAKDFMASGRPLGS